MKFYFLFFLLKLFLSQEILNLTQQLETFSLINSKLYKGTWNLIDYKNKTIKNKLFKPFKNDYGTLKIIVKLSKYPINKFVLTFYFQIFDGTFQDNWILLSLHYIIRDSDLDLKELRYYRPEYQRLIINRYNEYINRLKDFILEIPNENSNKIIFKNRFNNKTVIKSLTIFQINKIIIEPIKNITLNFSSVNEIKYNFVNGIFISEHSDLSINFTCISEKEYFIKDITNKYIFLFSLILICLFHFMVILTILKKKYKENCSNFINFSPILIGLDISYNALICLSNISISSNDYLNSRLYALISLIYFFLFGFFETILFYFSNKIENYKGIVQLIIISFGSLIILLINLNFLFTYKIFILIFLYTTFIPQIIYNISFKEKPNSIPLYFQISLLLNRLFIPLYLKGVKNNIFNANINYFFCISLILINGFQMLILYIQQKMNGDIILLKKCKKKNYKYKKNIKNILKKNPDFYKYECSICLNPFTSIENINSIQSNKYYLCIKKLFFEKPIFIYQTPCQHFFHIECLDNWMNQKKECPVCRAILPNIM